MAEWLLFLKHDSTYKVLVLFICTSYDQLEIENNSYLFAPPTRSTHIRNVGCVCKNFMPTRSIRTLTCAWEPHIEYQPVPLSIYHHGDLPIAPELPDSYPSQPKQH
jgi:hypothetical protein